MKYLLLIAAIFVAQNAFCQGYLNVIPQYQANQSDPYDVPTPNQSSLGSYGVIPVSPYTGKADVSLPIYSTEHRNVPLNINLTYDTSGLLINQLPGWTGHNWTLNAGGAITRKINGSPDEINYAGTEAGKDILLDIIYDQPYYLTNGYYITFYDMDMAGIYDYYFDLIGYMQFAEQGNIDMYNGYQNYFHTAHDNVGRTDVVAPTSEDSSADIFYFNFMGISGCFVYGNDGNWKVRSEQNIDVIFDVEDTTNYIKPIRETFFWDDPELVVYQPKVIKGFTLVDQNGNRYIFGGDNNYIEYSTSLVAQNSYNTTEPYNAVSWMLREVQDRFGNILYSFNYSRGNHIVQIQNSYNDLTRTAKSNNHVQRINESQKVYSGTINFPVYLDSLSTIDGTRLVFNHSSIYSSGASSDIYPYFNNGHVREMLYNIYPRMEYQNFDPEDYTTHYDQFHFAYTTFLIDSCMEYVSSMNLEKLNSIRIKYPQRNNESISDNVYTFVYDSNNRIHLTQLLLGNGTGFSNSYEFEYDRFNSLPSDYLTKQFDNWGYYNGINYDSDIEDAVSATSQAGEIYYDRTLNNEYLPRVANLDFSKRGMLTKIVYPTGGYSLFEYEQNSCHRYMSDNRQSAIELSNNMPIGGLRIKSIANYDNNQLVGKKTYTYTYPSSSISSGELNAIPKTYYRWEDSDYIYEMKVVNSMIPLSNAFAPIVGYSYVTETDLDGSSTVYSYTNFSSEKDIMYDCSRFGTGNVTPFDEFSSRQYMSGKLLSETKFDSNGDSISHNAYTYTSDTAFNDTNYVATTCFNVNNLFTNVGSRYRIFYYSPSAEKIVSKTKYGNLWVTDEATYNRIDTVLTITNALGHTHSANIYNNISETHKRGNSILQTIYSYPYLDTGVNNLLAQQFCLPITGTKRYLDGNLLDGTKTVFRGSTNIVPSYDVVHAGNINHCDTVARYITYSPTYRLTEMIDKNNVSHRFYWNNYDQLIGAVTNGGMTVSANMDIDDIISNNASQIYGNSPVDAKLYEYDGHGNVSKITSGNKQSNKYLYDEYGRLTDVIDTNDKTVKRYDYNYGKQINNPILSY